MNVNDPHTDKQQRRRERNRLASQRCRLRKKQRLHDISKQIVVLEDANTQLKSKIKTLQKERDGLLFFYTLSSTKSEPDLERSEKVKDQDNSEEEERKQLAHLDGKVTGSTQKSAAETKAAPSATLITQLKTDSKQVNKDPSQEHVQAYHKEIAAFFNATTHLIKPEISQREVAKIQPRVSAVPVSKPQLPKEIANQEIGEQFHS